MNINNLNCKSIIFNFPFSIFNFKAFSLIELSIVLIIIGLLIAGVTGGASLIQSAKVRSLINEIKDYERAVYTFQAARGRYPGDVKNYGTFGHYSNYDTAYGIKPSYSYKTGDFPLELLTEFQKTAGSGILPSYNVAPFLELYNEGIIDFKPLGNSTTADKNNLKKGFPNSKVIEPNNVCIYISHTGPILDYQGNPSSSGYFENGLSNPQGINENLEYTFRNATYKNGMDPKILKQVDIKLDDGEHWNGKIRSGCYGKTSGGSESNTVFGYTDYDYAINNGKKCIYFEYAL